MKADKATVQAMQGGKHCKAGWVWGRRAKHFVKARSKQILLKLEMDDQLQLESILTLGVCVTKFPNIRRRVRGRGEACGG